MSSPDRSGRPPAGERDDDGEGEEGGGPGPALGGRHEARERAVGLLYEAETKSLTPTALLATLPIAPDAYAVELLEGVGAHADSIDELLRRYAKDWKLERMPALDRAVLRLATFELLEEDAVPTAVVISEAVELAKAYSTDESGRFVNGMLSAIADAVRGPARG